MVKIEDLVYRRDLFILSVLIAISILFLLYLSYNNFESDLNHIQNVEFGSYLIKGYISNVRIADNRTRFLLSNGNNSIEGVVFDYINIKNGDNLEGYCQISYYNSKKNCIFRKEMISISN